MGVWYEYDSSWEYINSCEQALEIFDNAVSWSQLKSHFEDNTDLDEMQENDVAGPSRFLKGANPYTKKVAANVNAEYFIALCKEQDQPDSATMYQMYFINNTSAPIDIILEVLPGTSGKFKSGGTVNDLMNDPALQKSISRYENIPVFGYVRLIVTDRCYRAIP